MSAISIVHGVVRAPTMTSLELVEFINSERRADEAELRHDHFMAKVPKVLGEAAPKFLGTAFYTNGTGAQVERAIYRFPKREACLMAMSYSYELQAKVYDRMTALEQAANDPIKALSDPAMLRGVLLGYTERVIELTEQVQELAPKAAVCDRIADAEGSVSIREAANTLRVPERKFVLWLQQHNWVYRRSGHKSLLGYADKVKSGYLFLKQTPIRDVHTGEERLSEQVRITPLGLTVLAKKTTDIQAAA